MRRTKLDFPFLAQISAPGADLTPFLERLAIQRFDRVLKEVLDGLLRLADVVKGMEGAVEALLRKPQSPVPSRSGMEFFEDTWFVYDMHSRHFWRLRDEFTRLLQRDLGDELEREEFVLLWSGEAYLDQSFLHRYRSIY